MARAPFGTSAGVTLRAELLNRIQADGPLSVADFMTEALLHPVYGYYTTRDPLGRAGDFTTAPEISQMFGEMIGLALAQAWIDQGRPEAPTLAEFGPGRGTLMADILRACAKVPGFRPRVVLLEASPTLRAAQNAKLNGYDVTWIDTPDALPDAPLFWVANEFFDALPIRQFQRCAQGWREIRVGRAGEALVFGLGQMQPQPVLAHRLADTVDGTIVEICPSAATFLDPVLARITRHGGAGLAIDYGDWRARGDTLQALRAHRPVEVLAEPGQADITAHVDFEALAQRATTLRVTPMTNQGIFLERLGITQRAQTLAQRLTGAALDSHIAAHRRLTHPDEMGNLFKVLGFAPRSAPHLPGLEP